jgi:hypothetical protein
LSSNTPKVFLRAWGIHLKKINIFEECTKSILYFANRHKIELIAANRRPKPPNFLIQNQLTKYD